MRALLSSLILLSLSAPALAEIINSVPEPESIALIAVGVLAAMLVRRKRK